MDKLIPGKFRVIWMEKRRSFFPLMIFATLLFCIALVGCEETTPIPPEIVYEKDKWCSSENDLVQLLSDLGDEVSESIKVEICIPGGLNKYSIETAVLDQEQKNIVKKIESPFPIATLMTFFQVKDQESDKLVTKFDPPLELRITYSTKAWLNSLENELAGKLGHPRVAYLVKKNDLWADNWVELNGDQMHVYAPGTEGITEGTGVLIIIIEEIPDPLIGGC